MSPLLPPERLREIRARAENATPGPWAQGCWGRATNVGSLQEGVGLVCPCGEGDKAQRDAEFIAHAREDIPQLLDALESAESLVRTLGAFVEDARRSHYDCEDCWYSCPKAPEGSCNDTKGDECDCGADEWNARVDAALTQFQEFLTHQEAESDGP